MQTQKESIPDRASVDAKKDDFGTKKPRKKQSCDAPISKQESHIRDLCSYFLLSKQESHIRDLCSYFTG